MTEVTLPALDAIRRACARAAGELTGDNVLTMQRVDSLLGRLMAEHREVPHLADTAADGLCRALGRTESAPFASVLGDSTRTIAGLPRTRESLADPVVSGSVSAELRYWKDYAAVMQTALQPTETEEETTPQQPASLDIGAFLTWLRASFPQESDVEIDEVLTASMGYSKKTMLVTLRNATVLPTEVALRIDQPGSHLGTTVRDEFPLVCRLWDAGVRLPQPLGFDDGGVLGQPFIMFARVEGAPLGTHFVRPARNEAVVAELAHELAALHAAPVDASMWPEEELDPARNLDREIAKVRKDWTDLGMDCPTIEAAFVWVETNRDLAHAGHVCVVHNDYGYSNVLFSRDHVSAVVDWELAYAGVPAADLGYFFPAADAVSSFEHFLSEYVAAGGTRPPKDTLDFYILWGQLRLAVMVFQSEAYFRRGHYKDVKYGAIGPATLPYVLDRVGTKLIDLLDRYRTTDVPVG